MAKKTSSKKINKKTPTKARTKKTATKQERGLGRGLSALMADVNMDAIVSEDVVSTPNMPAPDLDDPTESVIMDDIMESPDPMEDAQIDTPQRVSTRGEATQDEIDAMSPDEYKEYALSDTNMSQETLNAAIEIWLKKQEDAGIKTAAKRNAPAMMPSTNHNIKSDVTYVELGQLERNPEQPRKYFNETLIKELADSIRQKGILQPILVREIPGKTYRNKSAYQVIAGERRWQAAQLAELDTLPVFIREITDQEALEIGVIENVQRAELNPVEEALAYKALINQFDRTQEDVAKAVGKSRSHVANMLRILNLPEEVHDYLVHDRISMGHARAIIAAPDPIALTEDIIKHDMSVREAEDWVRRLKKDKTAGPQAPKIAAQKGADERRLEAELMDALGLTVDLRHKGVAGGELRIKYKTSEQLDDVVKRIVGE